MATYACQASAQSLVLLSYGGSDEKRSEREEAKKLHGQKVVLDDWEID